MGVKDFWPFMKKRFPSACTVADGPTDATHILLDASTLIYAGVKGAREPFVVWVTAQCWIDEMLRFAPAAVEIRAEFDTRGAPKAKIVGRGPEKPVPFAVDPAAVWDWDDAETAAAALCAATEAPKASSSHFHVLMGALRDTAAWPAACTAYHAHMVSACLDADPALRIMLNGTRCTDPPTETAGDGRGRMFGAGGFVPRDAGGECYDSLFYGGSEVARRPSTVADPDGAWGEGDAKVTRDLLSLIHEVGAENYHVMLYSIDSDVLIRAVLALNAASYPQHVPRVSVCRSMRNGEFEMWNVNELVLEMKKIGRVESVCKLLLLNGNDFMSHPKQYSLPRIFAPLDALKWLPVTDADWVRYQFLIEAGVGAGETAAAKKKLEAAREVVSNSDMTAAAHLGLEKKPVPVPSGTGKRYKAGGVPDGFAERVAAAVQTRTARARRLEWTLAYFSGDRFDEFSADWGYGKNESRQLVES